MHSAHLPPTLLRCTPQDGVYRGCAQPGAIQLQHGWDDDPSRAPAVSGARSCSTQSCVHRRPHGASHFVASFGFFRPFYHTVVYRMSSPDSILSSRLCTLQLMSCALCLLDFRYMDNRGNPNQYTAQAFEACIRDNKVNQPCSLVHCVHALHHTTSLSLHELSQPTHNTITARTRVLHYKQAIQIP